MFLNENNERREKVVNSGCCISSLESRYLCGDGVKGREEGGWGKFPEPV